MSGWKAILLAFGVGLMPTALARPDRTKRSATFISNSMSAPNITRLDKNARLYISTSGIDDHGIEARQKLIPASRTASQNFAKTTRREYGVRHTDPCLTKTEELNPKDHFKTEDNFSPSRYKKTICTGSASERGYPNCVYGVLDCVTIYEDISFIRMPSQDCSAWFHDVIKNVPVGCQCMWPN